MAPQWLTIAQHGPEIAGFRPATPGIEHPIKQGGGGLIHMKPGAALFQQHRHAVDHRGDQRARSPHPGRPIHSARTDRSIGTPSRAMTTACRFEAKCPECLETAICARSASVGQLPSSRCAGALA